jgi:hypothetical protein
MSLYLQIAVGAGRYLLDASHILEIRSDMPGGDDVARRQEGAIVAVDLRELFDETAGTAGTQGSCVVLAQTSGPPAALIVDRVDGLAEFGAAEFCPLPPIGPLGLMIDAVAMRLADRRPLLRLRGERALATAAALG